VDGATANALPGAVAPEVMDERYARFMEKAAAISEQRMAAKVGREIKVLIDRVDGASAVGRGEADAPEIDGVVNIRKAKGLKPGEFARVRVTAAGTYDLAGELL
jgi:ribosomal protein S12 methylthiotransferase